MVRFSVPILCVFSPSEIRARVGKFDRIPFVQYFYVLPLLPTATCKWQLMDIAFTEGFKSKNLAILANLRRSSIHCPTFSESNVGSTKSICPGKSQMENWTKEELATSSLTILLVLSRKSVSFGDILWKTTWRKERERFQTDTFLFCGNKSRAKAPILNFLIEKI